MRRKARFILFFILCAMCWAAATFAAGVAIDSEAITPGNAATGFTTSKISKSTGTWTGQRATGAFITVEDNSINFTLDGSTPTQTGGTNVGHRLDAGQSRYIAGAQNVANFRCIDRTAGSAATVKATYFYGGE